jgi:hypothetical protein
MRTICRESAKLIGPGVSAEDIAKVIHLSNLSHTLFHGIREVRRVRSVIETGIAPLTPEGGYASYWTSGERLFATDVSDSGSIQTKDTTFFDYGHSRDLQSDDSYMTIALANEDDVRRHDTSFRFERNGYMQVHNQIPARDLHIVFIEVPARQHEESGRPQGQRAELAMFQTLHALLRNGYEPGEVTRLRV